MKVVAYIRVSTRKQGESGLGQEAQQTAIDAFCRQRGAVVLETFSETESGKNSDRPELLKALHLAKITGATLVIAKLDRLSRNAAFLLTLRDSGARFVAADMPTADHMTVGFLAIVAEHEREAISKRTREALQAAKVRAKAKGERLGNPNGAAALRRAGKGNAASLQAIQSAATAHAEALRSEIATMQAEGLTSLGAIAKALNDKHMLTPRGGLWHKSSVRNLLDRLASAATA